MLLFEQPAWLLLAAPLYLAWRQWPLTSRALRALHAAALLLILLALSQPALRIPARGGTLVFVVDRSASMPTGADAAALELIATAQSRMGARDRLGVVAFGRAAAVEQPPQAARFAGFAADVDRDGSDLAAALDAARALIPPGESARVLVVSDGQWTGRDPIKTAAALAARGIAVDYRLLRRPSGLDTAVVAFRAPDRAAPGEAVTLEAEIAAPPAASVPWRLRRDGRPIAAGRADARAGRARLLVRDRAPAEGVLHYRLELDTPSDDPLPENNTARVLTGVAAPRPALLVSPAGGGSGLGRALESAGLAVRVASPTTDFSALDLLASHAAVVVENTPADAFGRRGLEALAHWVEQAGGGLLMTGGKSAFGLGGYYRSPLEPVLPVSLEMRREHRKLNLAIVVALDRSGSMQMPAGPGRVKMDLANLGAAEVLDLLAPTDEFGVLAVDTVPHTIIELGPVERARAQRGKILRIASQGGGIYVYEALTAALKMLARTQATTRHIILFADAADAEEPGAYRELLAKARAANVTCSVIGLGTPQDVDAELLRDIARAGGGEIYFTSDAADLPRLFAQDTFAVARNTFIEEPTAFRFAAGLRGLTPEAFGEPPPVGGYNLCYARPGANVAAVTLDEYAAPIVAAWPAGVGRVAVFTGEADGAFTGPFGQWPDTPRLLGALGAWVAGAAEDLPEGVLLTRDIRDGVCAIEMHLDPERTADPLRAAPRVRMLRGRPGEPLLRETAPLRWVTADRLVLEVPLRGAETLLATVEWGDGRRATLPPACLPYSPEYAPAPPDRGAEALAAIAAATGGRERLDIAGIWSDLPRNTRRVGLAPWLALASALALLAEVAERRTGGLARRERAGAAAEGRSAGRERRRPPRRAAPPEPPSAASPAPTSSPAPPSPAPTDDLRSALRGARRDAERRLKKGGE